MVWTPQTAANRRQQPLALSRCDRFQVPANRIGFIDNGGPFSLVQLKVIQECISLIVFAVIANILFQGESLHWNHFAAFLCLIAAVYFVFMK